MPTFDDRFARQNRCEPPPEFPLASPYAGIVHHLSGPNSYALTQIHPRTSGSVDGAPPGGGSHLRSLSLRVRVLAPKHSHKCSTPWSVFQDGSLTTITPASLHEGAVLGPAGGIGRGTITLPGGSYVSRAFVPPAEPMLARARAKCTSENAG